VRSNVVCPHRPTRSCACACTHWPWRGASWGLLLRRAYTHTNYYRLHVIRLRYRHNINFVRFRRYSLVDDSLPNLTRGRRLKNKYTHHTYHVISLSVRNGQRFLVSFLYSSSEETLIKTKYPFDFRHRCLLLYSHKFVLFTNFSRRIIIIVVSTCTRDVVTRSYMV